MKRMKLVSLAWTSMLVVGGITAAATLAGSTPLPDIQTALPGETYPLLLGGHLKGVDKLENADGGGVIEGDEFSVLLSAQALTSLGKAALVFLGLEEVKEKHKCSTEGASEANGEVVVPNAEWHLVYTALSPTEKLEFGALILFTAFIESCNLGAVELTIEGPWLMRVSLPTAEAEREGDSADIETESHCPTQAVQELPYYYDDTLTRVATTLLARINGAKAVQACEEIVGTILLTPGAGSAATMFSILF